MPSVEQLLTHDWWRWEPPGDGFSLAYRGLNLIEGCVWLVFAGQVLARYLRHRHSPLELLYALAFALFGASDFREACALQGWLIVAKGLNLALLVWLRQIVIRRYYPASRVY